jgi:hypothetical protein
LDDVIERLGPPARLSSVRQKWAALGRGVVSFDHVIAASLVFCYTGSIAPYFGQNPIGSLGREDHDGDGHR